MERWIAQSIARDHGVCANTRFYFPRVFLEHVFGAIPDEVSCAINPAWEVRSLTWRIARLLDANRDEADFAPLVRHLDSMDGDWRLVQLANRIANLLDQYVIFRPDWIEAWTRATSLPENRDERWQARLVREIHDECGGGHVADRALAFRDAVASGDRAELERRLAFAFPDRIEIFAVAALPPLYLSVIDQLARVRDLHLSVLSPSRHYWADLWKELKDEQALPSSDGPGDSAPSFMLPTSPAASLLAGLGRLGSDFQQILEAAENVEERDDDRFESAEASRAAPSLLSRLQDRLLELDDSDEGIEASTPGSAIRPVARDDASIRVHLCHGPRREIEVVESVLRKAFEDDPSLSPEDVIVMAPRIDEIAPDIEAVFGARLEEASAIPFRIADRGIFRRSPVAEAFRSLLELLGGRAARSECLDWIAREPVRARFGLDEKAIEHLSDWADRAGIRFGLNERHRESMGLSGDRTHSWAGGLDRLALAHAVGASDEVYAGSTSVPLDALGDPVWLGALGDIVSILSDAQRWVGISRSVMDWCGWLMSLLDRCIERTDSNSHEHVAVRGVLADLASTAREAGFERSVPFEAVRERIADSIESTPAAEAFLAGGVTFCELVPLRAIPFRVIVLLGMADGVFPRGGPAPGFDLMTRDSRPGDRTSRNDDRYLFLEALLSARDQLVITAPAFDMRDGSRTMPSVVVSDLLDTLDSLFVLDDTDAGADAGATEGKAALAPAANDDTDDDVGLRDWLVVSHPLRASSPRYFETSRDPRLVGFDEEAFAGAVARREASESGGGTPRRFLAKRASAIDGEAAMREAMPTLSLDELSARFLRSTRFFARDRLGLRLPRPEAAGADLDPLDLDPLARHALGGALLERLRDGLEPESATQRLLANAAMPAGVPGRVSADRLRREVESLVRIGAAHRLGESLDDLDFELELESVEGLGDCRLVGRLDRLWSGSDGSVSGGPAPDGPQPGEPASGGRIAVEFARVASRVEWDLWIRHLVLCAVVDRGEKLTPRTVFVGRPPGSRKPDDRVVVYERVHDSIDHLKRLFAWAWTSEDAPLPFFPKTSWAYAELSSKGNADQGWRQAHRAFGGGDEIAYTMVESEEELEFARVWEGWSPLASEDPPPVRYGFVDLADRFFEPLIAARKVGSA